MHKITDGQYRVRSRHPLLSIAIQLRLPLTPLLYAVKKFVENLHILMSHIHSTYVHSEHFDTVLQDYVTMKKAL